MKNGVSSTDDLWKKLILMPEDYSKKSLLDEKTRQIMNKIELVHGGEEFDKNYPDGIPSQVSI